jgi:hypothetical protein
VPIRQDGHCAYHIVAIVYALSKIEARAKLPCFQSLAKAARSKVVELLDYKLEDEPADARATIFHNLFDEDEASWRAHVLSGGDWGSLKEMSLGVGFSGSCLIAVDASSARYKPDAPPEDVLHFPGSFHVRHVKSVVFAVWWDFSHFDLAMFRQADGGWAIAVSIEHWKAYSQLLVRTLRAGCERPQWQFVPKKSLLFFFSSFFFALLHFSLCSCKAACQAHDRSAYEMFLDRTKVHLCL